MKSAFTLIELLVVIAIIAILAVVVVLTLNPAQLLAESRDSNRIADMATLNSALNLYQTDRGGVGTIMGSSSVIYYSFVDPSATSASGTGCATMGLPFTPASFGYHCGASSTYRKIDSSGWIPVNFQSISGGSPFGNLPVDPSNTSSSRLYYTYSTNGVQYEVTAAMESTKYKLGGSSDVVSTDGGTLTVYEKGTKLGLEPIDYGDGSLGNAMIGYWPLDEGTGNSVYNYALAGTSTGTWVGTAGVRADITVPGMWRDGRDTSTGARTRSH